MFPPLIKSIHESYNGIIREAVKDLNASLIEVEQKIQNPSKLTKTANDTVVDLNSQITIMLQLNNIAISPNYSHLLIEMRPTVEDEI